MPTLGSFSPAHERESPLANGVNGGSASQAFPQQQQDTSPSSRSFSAIVSPTAAPGSNGAVGEHGVNGAAGGKPFVYSREFLLSLYDEEKAKKRPIELAAHDVATRDLGGPGGSHKPWLLQEYREGEKEVRSFCQPHAYHLLNAGVRTALLDHDPPGQHPSFARQPQ